MRTAAIIAMAFATVPAYAGKDIGPLTKALFNNMALSYWCRHEIGSAHYDAALSIAKGALTPYLGPNEATLTVDALDKKLKADPRTKKPTAEANKCYSMKADAMHTIEVEKAKLGD